MTPEQLQAMIASNLYSRHLSELTWAEVVSVVGGATPGQKAVLVDLFSKNNGCQAGQAMQKAINARMKNDAVTEAAAMMADDSLTTAELLRVYG